MKKIKVISLVIFVLSALILPLSASAKNPSATTLSASSVTDSSVKLNGYFNPNGIKTSAWFELDSKKYGLKESLSGRSPISLSFPLDKLAPGTKYSFRLVATNASGTTSGKILTFTTKAAPKAEAKKEIKTVTEESASSTTSIIIPPNPLFAGTGMAYSIKSSSATLSGNWSDAETGASTWFEYGTKMDFGKSTSKTAQKSKSGMALGNISGLSGGTTYYFRIVAQNSIGKTEGLIYSFRTLSGNGSADQTSNILVSTNSATNVMNSAATLNGFIDLKGSSGSYWFEWGKDSNTISKTSPAVKLSVSSLVSVKITELEPGTTYYFRAVAQSDTHGIGRGEVFAFETPGKSYLAAGKSATALNALLTAPASVFWLIGLTLFYFLASFALHRFWA